MQGHLEDISAHFVLVVAHLGNNVAHLWDVVATRLGDVAAQNMWWLLFDMGAFFCKCDKRCSGSKGWKGNGVTHFRDGVTQLGESGLIERCGNSFWRRSGSDAIWNGLSRWCNYSNSVGYGIHGLARSGDTETYLRWEVAHLWFVDIKLCDKPAKI